MNEKEKILIFKSDAVGDLIHSLPAIYSIINNNRDKDITIYLSNRSIKFKFLINANNVNFKFVNFDLTIIEKIKIINVLLSQNFKTAYILTPKNFYFYIPFFIKKTKFFAICVNGTKNYKRPYQFLRKYLYKFIINDRNACFKRDSSSLIQHNLVKKDSSEKPFAKLNLDAPMSDFLKDNIPKNYAYFHIKKTILDNLNWDETDLDLLFNELLKKYENIVVTKDIEKNSSSDIYKYKYNYLDFETKNFKKLNSKIFLYDNIEGQDLYNIIIKSKKVIAFHGMMTSLASITKRPVLDLFYCKIKNWNDYKNYRNSFYEFKPKYIGYDFIIPKKDIKKTISKMRFSLNK